MDYLTSFSQLFDCLLVLVCLSGNLTVFRLLDCIFDYLTVFSASWLSFRYLTVSWLFDYLSAIWLSFIYLTIFQLFDCLFRLFDYLLAFFLYSLTVFWLFDYLSAIWLFFGYLTVLLAIWLSWLLNCLSAILGRYYNRTWMTLESH